MPGTITHLHTNSFGHLHVFKRISYISILFFTMLGPVVAYGQAKDSYDEISLIVNVKRIGSLEIPAVIYGQEAYLPVKELFDFLKIKNTLSENLDSVSGFFIHPKAVFVVDKVNNRILYEDKIFELKTTDLIRTETNLYLKTDYFGQVFSLACTFNFRSLSITLDTKLELPAIREMQQLLMRQNISQLKGEKKADTTIKRKFSLFHFGTADWSVISTQEYKGNSNTRLNLALGSVVAGGEADVNLYYNSQEALNLKQQYYRWRYVNNDHASLRQITAGRIFTQSISSLYAPVTGIQFTNTPTTYRKSFGSYRLSNTTEPGWMVELYVNNVLVNYMKADASGFFTFDVPIVYGNSAIKLRFYGPWGEERMREQNISIPFNFLPSHQFEYTVSAGIVSDEEKSRYSRINFNYGLHKRITVGGGVEYLSSASHGKPVPFMNASVRLGHSLLISGEHAFGVRTKGILNYRLPYDMQLDLNYTKYAKGQTAIRYNYPEERKASLSIPIRTGKFAAFSRLSYTQLVLPKFKYNTAEFLLSAIVHGVSSNVTILAVYTDPAYLSMYSHFSLTFRVPASIRFTPQVQYEHRQKNFSLVKVELEKPFFTQGFMNVSYERNLIMKTGSFGIGMRYNFSLAQTSLYARSGNKSASVVELARGSLLYDGKAGYLGLSNQSSVGKGGLIISPFLDINCNGKRDANEPKADGLKFKINGGRIEHDLTDTTIRVFGLEAYTNYFIELDKNSFENISWKIRKLTISVTGEPNHFQIIEVPVSVVGEASGNVSLKTNKGKNGLGRIMVNFYNTNMSIVGSTVTEEDGYFSFLGLTPGSYTARIDTAQLHSLKLISLPANLSFDIATSAEGAVVDGFEFILQSASDILNQQTGIQERQQPLIEKRQQPLVQLTQPPSIPNKQLAEIYHDQLAIKRKSKEFALRKKLPGVAQEKPKVVADKFQPGVTGNKQKALIHKKSQAVIPARQKSAIRSKQDLELQKRKAPIQIRRQHTIDRKQQPERQLPVEEKQQQGRQHKEPRPSLNKRQENYQQQKHLTTIQKMPQRAIEKKKQDELHQQQQRVVHEKQLLVLRWKRQLEIQKEKEIAMQKKRLLRAQNKQGSALKNKHQYPIQQPQQILNQQQLIREQKQLIGELQALIQEQQQLIQKQQKLMQKQQNLLRQ